jgi:actin-like ATPase involved in cell morphogenesis
MGPGSPGYLLGIDFGTSNTAAGLANEKAEATQALPLTHSGNLMPSSVFIASPTQIDVGDVALNKAALDPSGFVTAPKRILTIGQSTFHINQFDIPASDIVAAVLRAVLARAQARHAGRLPVGLVLTHPEGWAPGQVRVLVDAAESVGFPPPLARTVSEPQAAAHYYSRSMSLRPGSRIAVFDFGGGTLDVAVLSAGVNGAFEVVAARGDNALGGRNFDATLRRWVDSQLAESHPQLLGQLDAASVMDARVVEESIRHAKELLSETPSAGIDLRVGAQHERLSITRNEFEDLIRPEVARAVALARGAFDSAGITQSDQVQAIYLTGGSSRIPLVQREVQALGPVATLDDPKTVVAQGALIAAARGASATQPRYSPPPTLDRIPQPPVDRIPAPPQPLPQFPPPQTPAWQPGMPPPAPAQPWPSQQPGRRRGPLIAGLLGAAVIMLVIVAVVVAAINSNHKNGLAITSTTTVSTVPPDVTSSETIPSTSDISSSGDDAESAAVGDCVQVSGTDDAPRVTKLDCSDPSANAKVAIKYDNSNTQCPSRDYQSVWSSGQNFRTCYELNANDGDCFKDDGDKNAIKVACTDPTAKYRVEIHEGAADMSVCGSTTTADNAFVFPLPNPRTLCLRLPTG